jgi:hypothetical protein
MLFKTEAALAACLLLGACAQRPQVLQPGNREERPFDLGVNIHLDSGPFVAKARDMGATWVRIDLSWDSIEAKKDEWDFRAADAVIDNAKSLGLKTYATLAYSPAWACKHGSHNCVPEPESWKNFVRTVAMRYKNKVDAFGIWNEPNLEEFWLGSAKQYVNVLLRPAAEVIHKEAPGVLVAGPDLAHLYGARLGIQDFFTDLKKLDGDKSLDVLSHHLYGASDFKDKIVGFRFGEVIYRNGLVQILQKAGLWGRQAWITEIGLDSRDLGEDAQAKGLAEQMEFLKSETWIKKAFIFHLADDGNGGPQWGLLRADGSKKPAYEAMRNFIAR